MPHPVGHERELVQSKNSLINYHHMHLIIILTAAVMRNNTPRTHKPKHEIIMVDLNEYMQNHYTC